MSNVQLQHLSANPCHPADWNLLMNRLLDRFKSAPFHYEFQLHFPESQSQFNCWNQWLKNLKKKKKKTFPEIAQGEKPEVVALVQHFLLVVLNSSSSSASSSCTPSGCCYLTANVPMFSRHELPQRNDGAVPPLCPPHWISLRAGNLIPTSIEQFFSFGHVKCAAKSTLNSKSGGHYCRFCYTRPRGIHQKIGCTQHHWMKDTVTTTKYRWWFHTI